MVLGVNHSIEPLFSPSNLGVDTTRQVLQFIAGSLVETDRQTDIQTMFNESLENGTFQRLPITAHAKRVLKTAVEINPVDHVLMAAALAGTNGVSDESASKTVNLPRDTTPGDVMEIYLLAHAEGMKNISIYRDGSLDNQPRKLS